MLVVSSERECAAGQVMQFTLRCDHVARGLRQPGSGRSAAIVSSVQATHLPLVPLSWASAREGLDGQLAPALRLVDKPTCWRLQAQWHCAGGKERAPGVRLLTKKA